MKNLLQYTFAGMLCLSCIFRGLEASRIDTSMMYNEEVMQKLERRVFLTILKGQLKQLLARRTKWRKIKLGRP